VPHAAPALVGISHEARQIDPGCFCSITTAMTAPSIAEILGFIGGSQVFFR
jgi:hypothetical protein